MTTGYIVPSLHPSMLMRQGDDDTVAKFERTVVADLSKALRLIKGRPVWDEAMLWERRGSRLWRAFPTVNEVAEFIRAFYEARERIKLSRLTIDVETTKDSPFFSQLICIGIAYVDTNGNDQTLCIPILRKGGARYWPPDQEVEVRRLLGNVLADTQVDKMFHNKAFDRAVLEVNRLPVRGWCWDTIQAHHITDGELPHNLGYLGTLLLDTRYWKDDSKGDEGYLGVDDQQLRIYNCLAWGSRVLLADGSSASIQDLVAQRYAGKVMALDARGHLTQAQVYDWHQQRVAGQQWVRIQTARKVSGSRGLVVTPDHRIHTQRGWVEAAKLCHGDKIATAEIALTVSQRGYLLGTLLGDSVAAVSPTFRGRRHEAPTAHLNGGHTSQAYVAEKCRLVPQLIAGEGKVPKNGFNATTAFFPLRSLAMMQLADLRRMLYAEDGSRLLAPETLDALGAEGLAWWFGDDGFRQKVKRGEDFVCLALHRYAPAERERARVWFEQQFGAARLTRVGTLQLTVPATRLFAARIGPHLPPCVRYKLPGEERTVYAPTLPPSTPTPFFTPIVSVVAADLPTKTRGDRYRAETRYCLSTEEGNFFTTTGLVKNCRDLIVTQRIAPMLETEVRRLGLWNLYLEELTNVDIMWRATMRGLFVDEERRSSTAPELELDKKTKKPTGRLTGRPIGLGPQLIIQRDAAVSALRQITGNPGFDPGSPVQLQHLVFQQLGMPVVKISKKTGKPTLDREALMLLELAAHKDMHKAVLQAITSYRRATKLHSTFVEGLQVTSDGHFHPSWKLMAVSGRWTSSPNAQNWPTVVKRMFGSVDGYSYVGVDLSQAELRAIAYLANVASLKRMYDEDVNVHTVNAALLFKLQCPPALTDNTNPQTDAYLTEQVPKLLGGTYDYSKFAVQTEKEWKATRTLTKNYIFGKFYGAMDETVHTVLRSKRDPDTNKLLFPDVSIAAIQALSLKVTKQIYPEVPQWWESTEDDTQARGFYACELSGRMRWFRGGFKRNEILNFPVQALVASWMNKQMPEIQDTFDRETGGAALVVQQVHDALNASCPDSYAERAGEVMREVLSRPIQLLNGILRLPADAAKVGKNLADV